MVRTALTVITSPGAYAGAMTTLAWQAVTTGTSTGKKFTLTGAEIILAHHAGTASGDLGLTSVDDPQGRQESIVSNFTSGEYKVIGPMKRTGWMQPDGQFYLHGASTATINVIILKIPGL
jgi:hypothetical protein